MATWSVGGAGHRARFSIPGAAGLDARLGACAPAGTRAGHQFSGLARGGDCRPGHRWCAVRGGCGLGVRHLRCALCRRRRAVCAHSPFALALAWRRRTELGTSAGRGALRAREQSCAGRHLARSFCRAAGRRRCAVAHVRARHLARGFLGPGSLACGACTGRTGDVAGLGTLAYSAAHRACAFGCRGAVWRGHLGLWPVDALCFFVGFAGRGRGG